jgi:hypothetical protein
VSLTRVQFVGMALLVALLGRQTLSQNRGAVDRAGESKAALVTSVRVVRERGQPALEVVSTYPVVPAIQPLDSPPRLVIDLANARTGLPRKRIPVLQENILTIRTEQRQKDPPIMRIVLDLLVPYGYTWDAVGNRLMVRLKAPEDPNASKTSPIQPPRMLSLSPVTTPVAVPLTSGIGDVVLAGRRFAAGTSLTASSETAILHLARGGEVWVCPATTLSLTTSKSASDLMLGMSTGALELHYSLDASADTVLTPDFRILFAGPGEFHYAVSSDSHGNTCVRGLSGNTSPATVSELIGDRTYQVKVNEQAVFHTGRIDKVDSAVPLECGCPPPVPMMRADAAPTRVIPDSELPANITLAQRGKESEGAPKESDVPQRDTKTLSSGPETRSLPPLQSSDIHMTVDAPFVFRSKNQGRPLPTPTDDAAGLPVTESSARSVTLDAQVQPPPVRSSREQPEHRGVLRRIKGFFTAIFR